MMKLKLFQNWLKQEGIGIAVLTHSDYHFTYFTRIKPSMGCAFITPTKATILISSLDPKPVLKGIVVEKLEKNWDKKQYNMRIKKVGINKSSITVKFFEQLKKIYPTARFVDISEGLAKLRMVKTNTELMRLTKACRITDNTFKAVVKNIKHLKTEQGLADFIQRKIEEQGAELAFPTIVASGRNSAIPHHQTSQGKLIKGFLMIDFGAKFEGYCADMTRMLYLGRPSRKERELYALLLKVQQQAINQVKLNLLYSQLDKSVRTALGKYSSQFIHSLGHGVGLETHESPRIGPESKDKVLKNSVFTIEPGIYFPGQFGIRIEDTVLFDGKVKVLTRSSKKLGIINI